MTKVKIEHTMNWEQMVVVCSPHGEKFLAWVPPSDELKSMGYTSPKSYMMDCLQNGAPAELRDVRILASQLQVTPGPGGQGIGTIGNLMILMSVDMFPQGMEKHYTKVSAFYFPADNEDCRPGIEQLLNEARRMEFQRGAAEAGIEIPRLGIIPESGNH